MSAINASSQRESHLTGQGGKTSLLVERLLLRPDPGYAILTEENCAWTLTDFRETAFKLASILKNKGIAPGDRVALLFLNQKEYLAGFFAVLHAGGVVVPINSTLPPEDMAYVLKDSGSKLVLSDATFAPLLQNVPMPCLMASTPDAERFPSLEDAIEQGDVEEPGCAPGDAKTMRILMYTSGTTGKPKGVMLSEQNLLANMAGVEPVLRLTPEDRMLLALPLFHAYGQIIALYALYSLTPIYLVPNFAPKKIIQVVIEHQIAIMPLVPTLFSLLLSSAEKLGADKFQHLKICVSGGAALPEKLLDRIQQSLNLEVLEGYGLTETSPVLAVNSRTEGAVPLSVGRPLPNVDIKLVDEDGNAISYEAGQASGEGEILVRGDNVMLGYYNLPSETKNAFDEDGFFRTGDLGKLGENGHLFISGGRKKDLIIKAGENISPMRIELTLQKHPAIREAAVIGIPHEKLGEDIVACVSLYPEAAGKVTESDLRKFCQEHLTSLMLPSAIRFYDDLPKTPAGKVVKPKLKEGFMQG